jgi:hypothetical protein
MSVCLYSPEYMIDFSPRCSSHPGRVAVGDASYKRGRRIARGLGAPPIRAFEHEVVRRVCVECMERAEKKERAS